MVVSGFGQNPYNMDMNSGTRMHFTAPVHSKRFGDLPLLPIRVPVMRANVKPHYIDIPVHQTPEQIITFDTDLDRY